MPQYLAPGVYIEEVAGARPIEGVGTATGAFVGIAERGPIGEAVLISNWTQFVDTFGGFIANGYLAYAVYQFFQEGGTRCFVVRTCHYEDITRPATLTARTATITLRDRATAPGLPTLRIDARSPGSWGDDIAVIVADAIGDPTNKFRLSVLYRGAEVEAYEELTVDSAAAMVNPLSKYVVVTNLRSTTPVPNNRPVGSRVDLNDLGVIALARGLTIEVSAGSANGTFKLSVRQGASVAEPPYDNLTMADVERRVNSTSKFVRVSTKGTTAPTVPTPPATPTAVSLPFFGLAGGWDGLGGILLKDRSTPTPPATAPNTLLVSAWREGVTIDVMDSTTDAANRFKIRVKVAGVPAEEFDNLTMADVEQIVNTGSQYIEVDDRSSSTPAPGNRPALQTDVAVPSGLSDADFMGDEAAKNGVHAFDTVDDVNILAIPDRPGDREVILAAAAYCEARKDCFFIADPQINLSPTQVVDFKQGTGPTFAGNAFNSSFAALYYPWLEINDPLTDAKRLVPPSGAVAGTYSHTDVVRGVHKAPAGIDEGYLNSAVGVERQVTKGEQESLNPRGINVIRAFPGVGIVVWGARTLSADPAWKYVNVRRLLLFIEESIEESTQWVVFEPNDRSLWARVKRDVTAFLTLQWQGGALFGATPDEAFFVKVDEENNPPETRDLGRLIIDVGVAPVKPVEFVIFRITLEIKGPQG